MDQDQEEQLRQQKEMQKLEARIREAATRQAMPGATAVKKEGEAERRMRELYEERLQEYGDLAAVDEEKAEDERCGLDPVLTQLRLGKTTSGVFTTKALMRVGSLS